MASQGSATTIPKLRFDVVGLGQNAMDYIAVLPRFPEPQTKLPMREVRLRPGGQVATALTTCCRLGLQGLYISSIGDDMLGQIQMESLQREGIDTSQVRVVDEATTHLAFSLVEEGIGERTILWHRDERLTLPRSAVTRDHVAAGRILHLDGKDSEAALSAARFARDIGIPISIDIDQIYDRTTVELLSLVDYLIAAEDFSRRFTGEESEAQAALALATRFPRALTGITLGPRGAIFVIDGQPVRSPAFQVSVRDTTGSGDVFHGAFIFGILQAWTLERTIRFAHAAAAMKCRALGARTGIPTLEEVEEFLETAQVRTD